MILGGVQYRVGVGVIAGAKAELDMKYDLISCLLTNLCSYIVLYHGFHMVIILLNNLEEPSRNLISSVQL